MRGWSIATLLLAVACHSSKPATAELVAPPEAASLDDSAPRIDDATAEATNVRQDDPVVDDSWFSALPPLTLKKPNEAELKQLGECMKANRVQQDDVTPAELAAAAACAGALGMVGHEIRILKVLVERHPTVAEVQASTLRLGQAYEQIDVRPQAIDAYATYLRKYPAADDARATGQRAVCLAWSLGDSNRVSELLAVLEQYSGRRGFSTPSAEALETLCDRVPPMNPDGPRVER
jgi:hypothetical protein